MADILEQSCPACGYTLNAAKGIDEASSRNQPRPGDFAICAGCGQMLRIAPDGTLRRCATADLDLLTPGQRTMFTLAAERMRALRTAKQPDSSAPSGRRQWRRGGR